MDADLELDALLAADPNTLPYFITAAGTGRIVPVQFASLAASDTAELDGANWKEAVFRDVWPVYVGDGQTLKLVCTNEADAAIQGLVRPGQVIGNSGFLRKSLLESAPSNRHMTAIPQYRGVGRVLVARLIVESYRQGTGGRVQIVARPGSEGFYRALGLRESPRLASVQTYFVTEDRAFALLKNVLREA